MENQGTKPVKVIKIGGAYASVFVNEGKKGPWVSVSLHRRYQDKEGKWQTTDHYSYPKQLSDALGAVRRVTAYLHVHDGELLSVDEEAVTEKAA